MSGSADKMLQVLTTIAHSKGPLKLMELVERSGLDKSTASRQLRILEETEFVQRDPDKRYSCGPTLVSLAASVLRGATVVSVAKPSLVKLHELTGETSSLHIRVGDQRVCVDGVESTHALRRAVPLGESIPLHLGPTGKTIVAFLDPKERQEILRHTCENTSDQKRVESLIERCRTDYSLILEGDRTQGIGAIAVPMFNREGVLGAITVAGPLERWNCETIEPLKQQIRSLVFEVSGLLGGGRFLEGLKQQ